MNKETTLPLPMKGTAGAFAPIPSKPDNLGDIEDLPSHFAAKLAALPEDEDGPGPVDEPYYSPEDLVRYAFRFRDLSAKFPRLDDVALIELTHDSIESETSSN